jgi:hypothetical protein
MVRVLNWILFIFGLALVAVTIAMEADTSLGVFAIPAIGFFVALAFLPYVPFGVLNRRVDRLAPLLVCTLALIALSAFWIWGFGSVFWWNEQPDAQDGLALVVFPAYMIAAAGPIAVGAWALERYLS